MKFFKVKQSGYETPSFINPSQVVSMNTHSGQTIIKMTNGDKIYTDSSPRDIISQLEERL